MANDAKQWVEAIQEYANITELDAATLNRLIKEIGPSEICSNTGSSAQDSPSAKV